MLELVYLALLSMMATAPLAFQFSIGCCCTTTVCTVDTDCCASTPPSQMDVALPSGLFTAGGGGCTACTSIGGATYTLSNFSSIGASIPCQTGGGSISSSTIWAYENPTLCTSDGKTVILTIIAVLTCHGASGCSMELTVMVQTNVGGPTCCRLDYSDSTSSLAASGADCDTTTWTFTSASAGGVGSGTCSSDNEICHPVAGKTITMTKH